MNDPSSSRKPREGGADSDRPVPSGTRHVSLLTRNGTSGEHIWSRLRHALRGRSDANWRDTIEEIIDDAQQAPDPETDHERVLLGNILRLQDRTAYDVMIPRADIVALDVSTDLGEALRILSEKTHSRVPAFRESLDDVLGMVHIKDVLSLLSEFAATGDAGILGSKTLGDILRPVLIVAPSMRVLDLLLEMRQTRQHMALVVDEFGGIDGLITIEDLVEEIVGEIQDEHEMEAAPQVAVRPDGSYLADARLPLEDLEEAIGPLDLDPDMREDVDTLGGLVFSLAGRIPARGELLHHPCGLEFEVIDADPRRIRRLRLRRVSTEPTMPPGEDRDANGR